MKKVYLKDNIFLDENGNVYNIFEIIYNLEKNEIEIYDTNNNKIELKDLLKNEYIKNCYIIYKDLKEKNKRFGTGLKFGGVFRLYENLFDEHSKWIIFPMKNDEKLLIYDFLAKNRVAHSTRKTLLIAMIKDNNIIYLESKWKNL